MQRRAGIAVARVDGGPGDFRGINIRSATGERTGGELAPVVGPAVGVQTDLADRSDVDQVVHPPVPGPGEPVPDLLTGGGIDRCGAGPGREPVPVGEPGHVPDVGQDPGGDAEGGRL